MGFGSLEGHLAALKAHPGVQVGVRGGGVLALEVGALGEGLLRENPYRDLVRIRARVWVRIRVRVRVRVEVRVRVRVRRSGCTGARSGRARGQAAFSRCGAPTARLRDLR